MPLEHTIKTPLAVAVRKAGSQSAFGRIIGRSQSTVADWLRLNKPLPAEHVITVERELGISRHVLRPDIYPVEHNRLPVVGDAIGSNGIPVACNQTPVLQAAL